MAQSTLERPVTRSPRRRRRSPLSTSPRPVTMRVAHLETSRERATIRRPLPTSLLTAAQRAGRHPWLLPVLGTGIGVLASLLQVTAIWPLALAILLTGSFSVGVVFVAWVVRRRMSTGAMLRPQEAVIDTDQAIPSAVFMPMACIVGWMFATLLV